jgi:phosphoribosyl 1,2-cyclic phosphate phosphodiesterase
MKITFLGTGTSQGVPVIACRCKVCTSNDERDKRLRCSVLVELNGRTLVIDTGPDFRQQMLQNNVQRLDAVLFTHEHKDHVAGLDDVRAFNFIMKQHMDVYLTSAVEEAIRREFSYIFSDFKYPGIPLINLHRIENKPFGLFDEVITPIEVMHYKMPVLGFRIKDFVYITDANSISDSELEKAKGAEILVINALRREAHVSHFTLHEAINVIEKLSPQQAFLTHLSHQMGCHQEVMKELPRNVEIAYDGLTIEL